MKNENTLIIVLVTVLVIFILGGFGFGMMPHRDYGQWGSYWTSGFGWMGVIMFLIIILLILGIIWLTKQIQR